MPSPITAYRVFIATPGGLHPERKAFRATLYDYNETDAIQRGVLFIPVGWEDTLAGAGRPQGIIDEDLTFCDYFVLVIWDRWGTPPDLVHKTTYTSGTQEEFSLAEECYKDPAKPMRQLVAFFKAVEPSKLSDPGEQLTKVLEFKKDLESSKRLLFSTFDELASFEQQLRRHLAKWVREHEQGKIGKIKIPPSPSARQSMTVLMADNSSTKDPIDQEYKNPLLEEAESLADQGRLTEAETKFAQAIAKGNDPDAFKRYGDFLKRVGRLSQAQVMYERVLELSKEAGESWKSIGYGSLGQLYRIRGDLELAEKMHRKALEIDERLGRLAGVAVQYGKLGRIYRRRDDLDSAEQMHRRALEIHKVLKDEEGVAVDCGDLAQVYRHRNDLTQALEFLQEALQINDRLKLQLGIAIVCGNLGIVYRRLGDLAKAEEMHIKSLQINEQLGYVEGVARQSGSLALVLLDKGELAEAEKLLHNSLAINQRLGRLEGIAGDQRDLGLVFEKRGDLASAAAHWNKARNDFLLIGMLHEVKQLDTYLSAVRMVAKAEAS